jgi:hypothetical protein
MLAGGVMDVMSSVDSAPAQVRRRATMTTTLRRCVGSKRFGIEPHEAPVSDFPKQPSQKGGLGRMCSEHWRAYTAGLRRDALARNTKDRA